MGDFSRIHDEDAELLVGGKTNPSSAYTDASGNKTNFGQSGKTSPNPSQFFGGTNFGQSKKR
jgi:hypothetical protein